MDLRFCFYSGMVRPTEQEIIAMEKKLLLRVPKGRGHGMPCRVTQGSTRVGREAERARERHG